MDALVIVGEAPAPARLVARARHLLQVASGADLTSAIADLRVHLPRLVGVVGDGAHDVAVALHLAGLPVRLYTDVPGAYLDGIQVFTATDPNGDLEVADSLLDLIGNTPMVRLDRTARDLEATVLAKLEFMNPGGSSKDRPALRMVLEAERSGELQPGGTIVEPTSGNTGVGLAIVAARRGYRCVFVCPDKVAPDKIALLRAYGAEVVVCPTSVSPEHPESYYSVSDRLARELPNAWKPNQYHNPFNPAAQHDTTGPEIWAQTKGRITHFVAGVGTGGTISGIGRYLKEQNPKVVIVGADPEGSVYSGGSGRPYLVEGIGEDFWPSAYDPEVVDQVVAISDAESFATARRVTREEGILVGGSSGTAIAAALKVAQDLPPSAVVVVHVPDSGRGYLSKLYDDQWMAAHGFGHVNGVTVGDVLATRNPELPALVHTHPDETARSAVEIMREFSVSQLPVVSHEPPLQLGEVVGSVSERALMDRVYLDPGAFDRPVAEVMEAPLPTVGAGEPLTAAIERLELDPAVLVLDRGHPIGVITRSDALAALAAAR